MNPLVELRKDLKPIIEIKKQMDYRNCYDNKRTSQFFKGEKQEALEEGCNIIKKIIIDLGEKYKEERSE